MIEANLSTAKLILLLASVDFFASEEHSDIMTRAIARHHAGEAVVIPIIVGPCDWQAELLGSLPALLPSDGIPVRSRTDPDDAWVEVVRTIARHIGHSASAAAYGPRNNEPLIAIGPHVVATGARECAGGGQWTIRIDEFLCGGLRELTDLGDAFGDMPMHERYIIMTATDEGRALAAGPTWRASGGKVLVDVRVAPKSPRTDATRLPIDVDENLLEISGIDCAKRYVQYCMKQPIGCPTLPQGYGVRVGQMISIGDTRFEQIVRLELLRHMMIPTGPRINDESARPPLDFVERIVSIESGDYADGDSTRPVDIELVFSGDRETWRGRIDITMEVPNWVSPEELLRELLRRARFG